MCARSPKERDRQQLHQRICHGYGPAQSIFIHLEKRIRLSIPSLSFPEVALLSDQIPYASTQSFYLYPKRDQKEESNQKELGTY